MGGRRKPRRSRISAQLLAASEAVHVDRYAAQQDEPEAPRTDEMVARLADHFHSEERAR